MIVWYIFVVLKIDWFLPLGRLILKIKRGENILRVYTGQKRGNYKNSTLIKLIHLHIEIIIRY